jgi:hypothetical protein
VSDPPSFAARAAVIATIAGGAAALVGLRFGQQRATRDSTNSLPDLRQRSTNGHEVTAHGLTRTDVVDSGGTLPTSVTVHGGLLYVLNARGAGSIVGFTVDDGDLEPLAGSSRPLSGSATAPAQVSFSPTGHQLVVTERATQRIDLYSVGADGYATGPAVVASAGATPFGFGFDNKAHLVVSEAFGGAADASAVSSYDLRRRAVARGEVVGSAGATSTRARRLSIHRTIEAHDTPIKVVTERLGRPPRSMPARSGSA